MKTNRMMRRLLFALACLSAGTRSSQAAALRPGDPLPVRILYDNSGSMYPGYVPPGTANRPRKSELGVRFFHEYPQFGDWLSDFVDLQSVLNARSVGMWTFTSNDAFAAGDVREVHPSVPPASFDTAEALRRFPAQTGSNTFLTETLEAFTSDYTGLVWLITDNIVETGAGEPDAGVERFFRTLHDRPRYRSVHLYKLPFRDEAAGQSAALAVYGILVSPSEVPASTLAWYDRKLREHLLGAKRRRGTPGADLFAGREHLKFKNLAVDAMELNAVPTLKLLVDERDKGLFREGQNVRLELTGNIRSFLTQHSVVGGRYELALGAPFVPEPWAQRDLGLAPLGVEAFDAASGEIRDPIPPNGSRGVTAQLGSALPVSFHPSSLGPWLRLAWSGATVQYTGTVRMAFRDVNVRLERAQMAGIFGIGQASRIFDFQDVRTLDQVNPSVAQVTFALKTGSGRTALLVFAIVAIAAIAVVLGFVLSRPQVFKIRVTHAPEQTIALRRLGSHPIRHEAYLLGRLTRGLTGNWSFLPTTGIAQFTVKPGAAESSWDVRFASGAECRISIQPQGGGTATVTKPGAVAAPTRPTSPSKPAGIPPRLPRIDRP